MAKGKKKYPTYTCVRCGIVRSKHRNGLGVCRDCLHSNYEWVKEHLGYDHREASVEGVAQCQPREKCKRGHYLYGQNVRDSDGICRVCDIGRRRRRSKALEGATMDEAIAITLRELTWSDSPIAHDALCGP